ncbi:MAG: right-handed parallel beta-helix repeat-containing protein [Planctomycetia bacterium]|nr:right-handed parallel beta-helix repeat-containing protein [Planctomycetia bacterium]
MKSVQNRRQLSIESLEARRLLAPIDVTNTDNAGTGSLRWAIEQANLQSQSDEIQFDMLGAGQHVITLNTPLPKIVSPVTINGTTASGYAGTPLVRIQPSWSFGSSGQGLLVGNGPLGGGGTSTGAAIVRALSVTGFPQGGIRVEANADLQLYNSYIGLDLNGAAAGNSGNGIHYTGTNGDSFNRIEGNVISSNAGHGILMFDDRELDIVNNKIGTNVAGTLDFGNGQDGIKVQNAPSGMTTEVDITDNVISGNAMKGIELVNVVGTNTILRNKIGTNSAGNAAIPNTEKGVTIFTNTTISSLSTEVTDNLISGNGSAGIELTGADVRSTLITQNKIGVAADGSAPLGNGADGVIVINGARENYVA